jgi:hypothetical protein
VTVNVNLVGVGVVVITVADSTGALVPAHYSPGRDAGGDQEGRGSRWQDRSQTSQRIRSAILRVGTGGLVRRSRPTCLLAVKVNRSAGNARMRGDIVEWKLSAPHSYATFPRSALTTWLK